MSLEKGRWAYDPNTRTMAWRKPQIQTNSLDETIQKLAVQGISMIAAAAILWFAQELARALQE